MRNQNEFDEWEEENFRLRAGKRSSYDVYNNEDGNLRRYSDNVPHYTQSNQNNFFYRRDGYPESHKPQSLNFERYASEGNKFINEVANKLRCDRSTAGRVTRAVLHALRDRLPANDAIQFAQGLPMALKGLFIDQYDISKTPVMIRHADDFINFIRLKNRFSAVADFHSPFDVIRALNAVFYVLDKNMDKGQVQQIKQILPLEIVHLIDQH